MSSQLKEIRRKIVNTRQIRRVTGTLQRVSAARLPADNLAIERASPYTEGLGELVRELRAAAPGADHPFLKPADGSKPLLAVVFGSERGLCGGFNSAIVARLEALLAGRPPAAVRALTVGKVVDRRLRRMGVRIESFAAQPARDGRAATIDRLASAIGAAYAADAVGETVMLYTRSLSPLRQAPVLERLLPLEPAAGKGIAPAAGAFEPAPREVLARLLPEYVRQRLDHAFLHSVGSEDAARQIAMSRATDNAGKILTDLRKRYSRLRQEGITREMIELAGGGSAQ